MIGEPLNPLFYLLVSFLKRFILLPRALHLRCVKLSGTAFGEEHRLDIFYAGEGESLNYLKKAYFGKVDSVDLGVVPVWSVKKIIRKYCSEDTIAVVETNRILRFFLPGGGHKTFSWIKQKVSIASPAFDERRKKIENIYGRKVRQQQYKCIFCSDQQEVEQFYDTLYVPYVTDRYKDNVHPRSLRQFQEAARSGFLLKVFEKDVWVAGSVCSRYGRTVRIFAGGMAPDYLQNLRKGAHSACEYYIFKWAEENSIKTIDMLRTRPNLLDGVYEYKRKWGAVPHKDIWPHAALWIYIPEGGCVPEIIKKQLVWDGNKFKTLETSLKALKTSCRR